MASTSASRHGGAAGRIKNAATTLSAESQSLVAEIRKALHMMTEIAVEFEKDNESAKVKDLENAVAELVEAYENCASYVAAIESVGNIYQPGAELTDFKKLLEDEFEKLWSSSSSSSQNHQLIRKFRGAVWNVHHLGQPMPGEEQEDIVMTSTQSSLLNIICPLSGKPVTELAEPVRRMIMEDQPWGQKLLNRIMKIVDRGLKRQDELLLQKMEKYWKSFQERMDKLVEAIQVAKENVVVFDNEYPLLEKSSEEQDAPDETSNKKDKCIDMEQGQDFFFLNCPAQERNMRRRGMKILMIGN